MGFAFFKGSLLLDGAIFIVFAGCAVQLSVFKVCLGPYAAVIVYGLRKKPSLKELEAYKKRLEKELKAVNERIENLAGKRGR